MPAYSELDAAHYRLFFERARLGAAFIAVDSGRIIEANAAFGRLFG